MRAAALVLAGVGWTLSEGGAEDRSIRKGLALPWLGHSQSKGSSPSAVQLPQLGTGVSHVGKPAGLGQSHSALRLKFPCDFSLLRRVLPELRSKSTPGGQGCMVIMGQSTYLEQWRQPGLVSTL